MEILPAPPNFGRSNFELPDTGSVTPLRTVGVGLPQGGWVLNPKSTFPLTVYGVDLPTAEEVKKVLDASYTAVQYEAIKSLTNFLVFSNLRCKEIDEYVLEFRPAYLKEVERLRQSSSEWSVATEKDKEDLLRGFQTKAIETLDIRPDCYLVHLFEWKPMDATLYEPIVERYGYQIAQFYLNHFGDPHEVHVIRVGHPSRSGFEQLCELGLARRGIEIPLRDILQKLKVKEMTQLVIDLNPPPFRRKAQACEFLMNVPNIKDRVGKILAFRELFQLLPLPSEFAHIDLDHAYTGWGSAQWDAQEIAMLLIQTYIWGGYESQDRNRGVPSYVSGWELRTIKDKRSCPYCERAAATRYARDERPKVPLHIGCRCRVSPFIPASPELEERFARSRARALD